MVGAFFLVISLISVFALRWLERRYGRIEELIMTDRQRSTCATPRARTGRRARSPSASA